MNKIMVRSGLIFLLVLLSGSTLVFSDNTDQKGSPDVDKIIHNYLSAIGGESNLRSVESRTVSYKVFMQTRDGYLMSRSVNREGTLRSQRAGSKNYLILDNGKLWNVRGDVKTELKGKVLDQFMKMADLDGPFIDFKKKGISIKYLGKEKVEFSTFLKLEVSFSDGVKIFHYFDQSNGLLKMTKEPSFKMMNGKITKGPETITYFYDYRKIKGVLYPFFWIQTDAKLSHLHLFQVENIDIRN